MPVPAWSQSVSLSAPCALSHLPLVTGFARSFAVLLGFDEATAERIEAAVEEAATNVIRHAFGPEEQGEFTIYCRALPTGMEVCIRDKGMPYDPERIAGYRAESFFRNPSPTKLGIFLMRKLMDEVEFRNLGAEGKETRLVKYLHGRPIFGDDPKVPAEPLSTRLIEKPAEKIRAEIRAMRHDEAIEVSKCFYDAYGYTYPYEHIYYPERMAALNENGEILSAVAVDPASGEVAAHAGLIFQKKHPALAELAMMATKAKYRGQSLASRLVAFLEEEGRKRSLRGLFTEMVSAHPYSQQVLHHLGFKDCGLFLGFAPASMAFRKLASQLTQRESLIIGYRSLQKEGSRTVFLAERHAGLLREVYAHLELERDYRPPEAAPLPDAPSRLSVVLNARMEVGIMEPEHLGQDFLLRVRQELIRLRREGARAIMLLLNLTDPGAAQLVPEFEKLGFFVTGIRPDPQNGDQLILQQFNGFTMDYALPCVESEFGKQLLAYAKKQDPGAL